jgi:hypothetical protein
MIDQNIINWLFAGLGAASAFILRVIWEGLRELQQADLLIHAKLNEMQLLVAGHYVRREDLKESLREMSIPLLAKLDKIEAKLDTKADR